MFPAIAWLVMASTICRLAAAANTEPRCPDGQTQSKVQFGADIDNVFNHPLLSPDDSGGGGVFGWLGNFNGRVDQTTGKLLPIDPVNDVIPNPDSHSAGELV